MKAYILFTGSSPLVILTSHPELTDAAVVSKLKAKGITKFIAHEVPVESAEQRYGGHFGAVVNDVRETDELRVLDYNGQRAFELFHLAEFGPATHYERPQTAT